jgi:hypothetical protein
MYSILEGKPDILTNVHFCAAASLGHLPFENRMGVAELAG